MSGNTKIVIVELSECELALPMCESFIELKRPKGSSAREALDMLEPEDRAAWLRAARTAIEYFGRTVRAAQPGASMVHVPGGRIQ